MRCSHQDSRGNSPVRIGRPNIGLICWVALASLLLVCPCLAETRPLWSIYWLSDLLPCEGYWGKPMTSASSPCGPSRGIALSICPRPKQYPLYPYDQGKPITVVSYQLVQILTVPTANGYMVIGSAHTADAADIFAMTGGVETNSKSENFPEGTGLPQGPRSEPPGYGYFDVYGVCDSGMQRALVNILYTSP
jgi:hypothetical protein